MNWHSKFRKAITFSYDDGNEQDLKLLKIFNAYGLKATFNVNTGLDWEHGTWLYRDTLEVHRMNLAECSQVYQGHEIAVHGSRHLNLTELTSAELQEELQSDVDTITAIFGTRPVGMAYSYGAYQDAVVKEVQRIQLRYARGVKSSYSFVEQNDLLRFRPTCHHDDPRLFALAEQFLIAEPETPLVFYIWGHSYEFEGKRNWDHIKRFCEMIAGKDDIFYGTNREVLLAEIEEAGGNV